MGVNLLKVGNGVSLTPHTLPTNPTNGDFYYDAAANTYIYYNDGFWINLASQVDIPSAASLTSAQFTLVITQNTLIRITGSTASTIYGISASAPAKTVVIFNASSAPITINNDDPTEPTPANRIITFGGTDIVVAPTQTVQLTYDLTQTRWILNSPAYIPPSVAEIAGQDIPALNPVYISAGASDGGRTAGDIYPVDTSVAEGAFRAGFIGFTIAAITSGSSAQIAQSGILGGFSGLTPGAIYYADPTTPGGITTIRPVLSGQYIVPVGTAMSTTQLVINAALYSSATIASSFDAYPNYFVNTESDLSTAITNATSFGGGVICLMNSFTISSAHTLPTGTVLIGRKGGTIVTVASGGSISFASGARMEDVWFTTTLTSGSMVTIPNNYSVVRGCQFTIPTGSTGQCISVSGNRNIMYDNTFIGVLTGTAIGINYTAGSGNADENSIFS
jgi:hypothetical protein